MFKLDGTDAEELKAKLAYAYNYNIDNDELNALVFGRAKGYSASKCKTRVGDAIETLGGLTKNTKSLLGDKSVVEALAKDTSSKMRGDRYYEINFSNTNTTEFRKGRGSINCERIAGIVMYCYLMSEWVKATEWADVLSIDSFKEYLCKNAPSGHPLNKWLFDDEADN